MRAKNCAEMTGAFVCAALSIVPTVRHADHLASWLEVLHRLRVLFLVVAEGPGFVGLDALALQAANHAVVKLSADEPGTIQELINRVDRHIGDSTGSPKDIPSQSMDRINLRCEALVR